MSFVTDDQIKEYASELESFVLAEKYANLSEIQRIWALPLQQRVEKGYAIDELQVTDIHTESGVTLLTLQSEQDHSRFREGDAVKVTEGDPTDPLQTRAKGRIQSNEAGLLVIEARSKPQLDVGSKGLVVDIDFIDLTERYQKAMTALTSTHRGRERIIPLLTGQIAPNITRNLVDRRALSMEGFNEEQVDALANSVGTDLCYLVQGPPGTGKTRVLARLVQLLIEQKPNAAILITSFTHRAIENALEAVLKSGVSRELVYKVSERVLDEKLPHVTNTNMITPERRAGPLVIGATPFALSSRISNLEFDWVIADEASQITLPLAVMAMLGGNRWIFFGDDKQMPPVVQSVSPKEAVEKSVFGLLREGGYHVMLKTTFRLPPEVAAWPSRMFYDNELCSGGASIHRRLQLSSIPHGFAETLSPEPAMVFVPCAHRFEKSVAKAEADVAARIVSALARTGFDVKKIGIVVPYRRQARMMRECLLANGLSADMIRGIVADTVERMQGQEREVVIVSLTTSSKEFAANLADFLFMKERLNVAITRTQAKLIVLGSPVWLTDFYPDIPEAELFVDFLRQCTRAEPPSL